MAMLTLDIPDDLMARLTEEASRWERDVRDLAVDRLRSASTSPLIEPTSPTELSARTRRVNEFRESLAAKGVMTTGDVKRMVEEGRP